MQQLIATTIKQALPDATVHVSTPDGTHYQAAVVSASFAEMSLVEQHRAVMNALKAEFDSDRVHALQLKTFTPERWEKVKDQFASASGSESM